MAFQKGLEKKWLTGSTRYASKIADLPLEPGIYICGALIRAHLEHAFVIKATGHGEKLVFDEELNGVPVTEACDWIFRAYFLSPISFYKP